MRLTIDVDDESLTRAAALTGINDHAALIRRALELLVRIESGRQLCALGGSDRDAFGRESGWIPETYAWGGV